MKMKERPILFSAPMVNAILDGKKTQTRRVIKGHWKEWLESINDITNLDASCALENQCPYGKPGDQLWVRETFHSPTDQVTIYRANWREDARARGFDNIPNTVNWKWTPSIHMPRWASRIQLEITGIRVERLQDISDDDALEEGVDRTNTSIKGYARQRFQNLWQKINGVDSWDQNPWVWVIEFERIKT